MREFDLLQHVYDASTSLPERVRIGPGDDMALVHLGGRALLAAVDQVVENRHFTFESAPLSLIGRKAVTRSLSDIAAMAARPVASLAAVALPPDFGAERATALFDAMRVTAQAYDCPLIGGDVALLARAGDPLVCAVTVLAEPAGAAVVTRSGARAGDVVYVTGALGGAYATPGGGGEVVRDVRGVAGEEGVGGEGVGGKGVGGAVGGRHLTFEPRIREAIELAETLGDRLHAMIDVSDGLGRDASHIARGSGTWIEIDADCIPCAAGVSWRRAAGEGEDYELLFTAAGDVPATLGSGLAVTAVGRVLRSGDPAGPRVLIRAGAGAIAADDLGWQHESAESP